MELRTSRGRPVLELDGQLSTGAASVMHGVLLRLGSIRTEVHIDAGGVSALAPQVVDSLLETAQARPRAHPLILDAASAAVRNSLHNHGLPQSVPLDITAATRRRIIHRWRA
jgi:hypothetical protein